MNRILWLQSKYYQDFNINRPLTPSIAIFRKVGSFRFSWRYETTYASRLAVATDNSVYQLLPQAVVLPAATKDVSLLGRISSIYNPQVVKIGGLNVNPTGSDWYEYRVSFDSLAFEIHGDLANDPPQGGDPVPEPSTILLFGAGLVGLARLRFRGKK